MTESRNTVSGITVDTYKFRQIQLVSQIKLQSNIGQAFCQKIALFACYAEGGLI